MSKPEVQPFGIMKVVDKASPILGATISPPDIPPNPQFEGGTGGAVVEHLFNSETIGLLGVTHDPLG